jgi:hypothetical protein
MYSVFTKWDDGNWLCIAFCKELREAMKLLDAFDSDWLHEYEVRDSRGNRLDFGKSNKAKTDKALSLRRFTPLYNAASS